jgi:lysozyme
MLMLGMTPASVKALKEFEGLVLETYVDAVGVPTIGWGHTGAEYAFPGNKITKRKAEELLEKDARGAATAVDKYVDVPLSPEQRSALILLVFNIGVGAFSKSTLLKKLNKADYLGAADEFTKWRKGGGKVLPGLVRRRWNHPD